MPLIVHVRSGGRGTRALCGVALPSPQTAVYQSAAVACHNCTASLAWSRIVAAGRRAETAARAEGSL